MKVLKLIVIVILVIPALAILLLGPTDIGRQVPRDREVVVVDYWEKWVSDEAVQMREIVDDFNNTVGKEKGIYVRYVSMSAIAQKTLVATAAGVPPDIAGVWNDTLVQLAALDAMEPLEDMARERGIDASYYKKTYWDSCNYNGHLVALISTPAATALHYNKRTLRENAAVLRAAGLDPDRPPRTIAELDAFAKALTTRDSSGRILRAGFLPLEPDWYANYYCFWFGTEIWDEQNEKFTLTDPSVVAVYKWIQSYSLRLGKESLTSFRSGLGNFDSPNNPFLVDNGVVLEIQGPWMANYIYHLKPGMSTLKWPREVEMTKPLSERLQNYEWAAAPFPSIREDLRDVSYCGFDALIIPRGAKHKKEAFEFIAYVNRQDVHEKLNKMHCKNSALANVSDDFIQNHPNPYIGVFEQLARSPNAHGTPRVPIWPEVAAELSNLNQRVALLEVEPEAGLAEAQARLQAKYEQFKQRQRARRSGG